MDFNSKFWQVTQEDLHAYFDGLGIVPRCSLCGHVEFSQPLIAHAMKEGAGLKNYLIPHGLPFLLSGIDTGESLSHEVVFPMTCEHCGTMLLVNAKSVVPEPAWLAGATRHG